MDARAPEAAIRAYLRDAPKVELHVHLEGAIRPQRFLQVLRRNRLHPHLRTAADVAPYFQCSDFPTFLAHFRFVVTCMRTAEDLHDVALDLFRDLVEQRVVYAEVIFSAVILVRAGLPLAVALEAVDRAAQRAEGEWPATAGAPPRYNLVLDLVRNFGADAARAHVDEILRVAHPRVVGVHLGGDEVGFPARDFGAAFARAAGGGLGCAVHAGEADGAASVGDAMRLPGVRRIGHGIRAVEDADLVRRIADTGITLEVCPTSNLRTGVVSNLNSHPLPALIRAGVRTVLGADDPSFFDTSLTRELELAHTHLGLEVSQLDACTECGLSSAFVGAAERESRRLELRARQLQVRRDHGLDAGGPQRASS